MCFKMGAKKHQLYAQQLPPLSFMRLKQYKDPQTHTHTHTNTHTHIHIHTHTQIQTEMHTVNHLELP